MQIHTDLDPHLLESIALYEINTSPVSKDESGLGMLDSHPHAVRYAIAQSNIQMRHRYFMINVLYP